MSRVFETEIELKKANEKITRLEKKLAEKTYILNTTNTELIKAKKRLAEFESKLHNSTAIYSESLEVSSKQTHEYH